MKSLYERNSGTFAANVLVVSCMTFVWGRNPNLAPADTSDMQLGIGQAVQGMCSCLHGKSRSRWDGAKVKQLAADDAKWEIAA